MFGLPRTDRAWIVGFTGTCKGVSTHGQSLRLFICMLSGVECAAALLKLFPASAKPLWNFRGRLPRSPFWASAKLGLFHSVWVLYQMGTFWSTSVKSLGPSEKKLFGALERRVSTHVPAFHSPIATMIRSRTSQFISQYHSLVSALVCARRRLDA